MDRRRFLGQAGLGIGMAALAELLQRDLFAQGAWSRSCLRVPDPGSRVPGSKVFRISRRRPSA